MTVIIEVDNLFNTGNFSFMRKLPDYPVLIIASRFIVQITNPQRIIPEVVFDIHPVTLLVGIDYRTFAIMLEEGIFEDPELPYHFTVRLLVVTGAVEGGVFHVNGRNHISRFRCGVPYKVGCLFLAIPAEGVKMVGAYPQSGLPGQTVILFILPVIMANSFGRFEIDKCDVFLPELGPVDVGVVVRNIHTAH